MATSMLDTAIRIAAEAHAGQVDKAGAPYVLHPLRVMLSVEGEEARTTAVLHDVMEDCPGWTRDRLAAAGISETVLKALDCVTKRDGEDYKDFVLRAGANPIARVVKMADLTDNMDLRRIAHPTERDHLRIAKYREAYALLEG